MSDDFLVHVDNIRAGYVPGVDILNGCSLELRDGELLGIIGPNGAGKSTLLKALFGLLSVREGEVLYRGDDISGASAHELVERGIGYVPQRDNVFPSLTIAENLEMGAFLRPKQVSERIDYVVEMFPRLGERLGQRAGSLSGGERQMLAMGRALMMKPSVLLLDEPSAGLSPVLQDQVFMRTARSTGPASRSSWSSRTPPLPADLRPGLRARPGNERLHGHRPQPARRPQGDRAVPRHPRTGRLTPASLPRAQSANEPCRGSRASLPEMAAGKLTRTRRSPPLSWRAPRGLLQMFRCSAGEDVLVGASSGPSGP